MTAPDKATPTLPVHRDTIREVSPPWLQRGLAERILYSVGLLCDSFGDALVAAVKLRFPGVYSAESLPLLGRERRLPRATIETDEQYAERLSRFLDGHRRRGSPYPLLEQLQLHYAPDNFPIDLLYANGVMFHMSAAGEVEREASSWRPDADAERWSRWWLMMYTDRWLPPPLDADEIASIRSIPRAWNAAHPIGSVVIMSTGAELWNWPRGHTWSESGTWDTAPAEIIEVDLS